MVKKMKDIKSNNKKLLNRIVKARKVLASDKATLTIKEREPAEYVSRFFKDEIEETKNAMFFK